MALPPVYDKYFTQEDSDFYTNLFVRNGLNPTVDKPKESFDAIFGNTQVDLQYVLRLPAHQFEKASELLEQEIRLKGLPEDYYLHDYKNEDLLEILSNPREWSRQDVIAAKIILEDRNVLIDREAITIKKTEQKELQKRKQKISVAALVLIYLTSPFGTIISISAGLVIYLLKDTDVDGKKDYVFSDKYRRHGLLLMIIGAVFTVFWYLLLTGTMRRYSG